MRGDHPHHVRTAVIGDFERWFALFDAVAAEQMWIGTEGPLDRESHLAAFERYVGSEDRTAFIAETRQGELAGTLGIETRKGLASIWMMVESSNRGSGVGSALMEACVTWADEHRCHKITLEVWPHNRAARSLYRKFGFDEEGTLHRQYRRRNGELWDVNVMGRVLDLDSPGSPYGE